MSVKRGACEYIWQGGKKDLWNGRTPLLFPICGRLNDGKYTYAGKTYEMMLHGFIRKIELECLTATDTELVFFLAANDETKAIYPFDFALTLTYRLEGDCLSLKAKIENRGTVDLPATFGGHPGFCVPFDGNSDFSDWILEFAEDCEPDQIEIAPSGLQSGVRWAYPLKDRRILPLSHDLFQIDGIFMARMARRVTLKSEKSERSVTLDYPDMPYLGIWHDAQTDAPFVCIEPWCGLPDYDNRPVDFDLKAQMFHLAPNTEKTVGFDMIFE
jgi:galactose mutarotase-like enzyme